MITYNKRGSENRKRGLDLVGILANNQSIKKLNERMARTSQRKNLDVADVEVSIWSKITIGFLEPVLVVVRRVI